MEFQFKNKVSAIDMWKLSMYHIYHSLAGVCNIIFSVAIILVTVKLWNSVEEHIMVLMLFACIIFPVIQPIMIYLKAKKQVSALPQDMVIKINETGVHVTGDNQKSKLPWKSIRGVIKEKGLIIIVAEGRRGYMLTDKILGTDKEPLIKFLDSKIQHSV